MALSKSDVQNAIESVVFCPFAKQTPVWGMKHEVIAFGQETIFDSVGPGAPCNKIRSRLFPAIDRALELLSSGVLSSRPTEIIVDITGRMSILFSALFFPSAFRKDLIDQDVI